uniref:MAM and LDL-receptor class A domain-containing protein 1-like n=1 Tax=Crassostrea virginica TaxID=6565 RepID=A0A8B8BBS4_CRAVI|nr:MAM and LDL-receptor class A domain-containing protein 1-like [Crassostrea virginica]
MYAYIEASGKQEGDLAYLESTVNIPTGSVCLKFDYHMYGKHVGSLEVVYENVTYFHEAGDKGDQWRTASITLTNTDSTKDQKIRFIASRGNGFKGDIAIDNIEVARDSVMILLRDV